jgi:hypothetical protein
MIIKSFKIFEELTCREFSEEIDKYLYPFTDEGFSVSNRYPGGGIAIYGNSVEFSKIKEDLFSLLSYISSVTDIYLEIDYNISQFPLRAKKEIKMKEFEDDVLSKIKDSYIIKEISIEL